MSQRTAMGLCAAALIAVASDAAMSTVLNMSRFIVVLLFVL
jgi:uncharacterized membrane protein